MNLKVNYSLTQLEYVLAVHRHGHFAKAAEACSVTQPTLSMQIQKLEEDLGVVLFDRSKKPILLTDVGKKLITQIQTIIFESKKIEGLILEQKTGTKSGVLTVGVIPTVAPYLLPRLLPIFENMFPDIELNLKELQTQQIINSLEADEIDVGIMATPSQNAKLYEFSLYYEPFYLLCENRHEYSQLKKIKHMSLNISDIWLLEEGHCLRNQVLDICAIKKDRSTHRQFKFESGSLETLKQIVDLYGGYTLLPQLSTENIGKNSRIIPFERPIPAREIGLVYRRQHYKTELIEALGEGILKSLPEELQRLRQKDLEVLPIA